MKVFRRLGIFLLIVVILLALGGFILRQASRQRPDWYVSVAATIDPNAQAEAATRAEAQMGRAVTWAAKSLGARQRAKTGTPPTIDPNTHKPDADPDRKLTITFSQAELNALFVKWRGDPNVKWDENYGKFISDPAVIIHDGKLIIAGVIKDWDTVASIHFRPSMTPDGKLSLRLERVMAGSLPMPQAAYERYRQTAIERLQSNLPHDQKAAKLRADGTVNDAAINATLAELALHVLNDQPADPILFIEENLQQHRSVPVQVTGVAIKEEAIDLTVQMLDESEQDTFLNRIKHAGEATLPAAKPN